MIFGLTWHASLEIKGREAAGESFGEPSLEFRIAPGGRRVLALGGAGREWDERADWSGALTLGTLSTGLVEGNEGLGWWLVLLGKGADGGSRGAGPLWLLLGRS